jgi:hypothetical protein
MMTHKRRFTWAKWVSLGLGVAAAVYAVIRPSYVIDLRTGIRHAEWRAVWTDPPPDGWVVAQPWWADLPFVAVIVLVAIIQGLPYQWMRGSQSPSPTPSAGEGI